MAKNERRRQQKLVRKHRKEKARKKSRTIWAHEAPARQMQRLAGADQYPLHECLIGRGWRESGLAEILVSRSQPDGHVAFAVFLVDLLCLGVKNAFWGVDFPPDMYHARVRSRFAPNGVEKCPLTLAHAIVYGGIDYAAQFGFEPHPDSEAARLVLGVPENPRALPKVKFGRDGKPCYVTGPDDDVEAVMGRLRTGVGEDGFDFLVGGPGPL